MNYLFDGFDTNSHDKNFQIRPFLKWAGGKFRLLEEIKSRFPKDRTRYIEPFLGGGSVALNVNYPKMIVSDVNKDLVDVYISLRDLGEDFIDICEEIFRTKQEGQETYYKFRKEFNSSQDVIRKSALFIYINKHCYNGLCRYNSKGEFNTPIGGLRMATCPSIEMRAAIPKLKKIDFKVMDFRKAFKSAREGDLIYCDPPYLPTSKGQAFVQYAEKGFGVESQIELAKLMTPHMLGTCMRININPQLAV
jgi:DNA adenine methylase